MKNEPLRTPSPFACHIGDVMNDQKKDCSGNIQFHLFINRFIFSLLLTVLFFTPHFTQAQTGTVASPYTALGMARNVTSAGIYYFNLSGTTFSTHVDANGWVQVAIDFGNGLGNLPQGTAITFSSRGILSPTPLSKLTSTNEARISSSNGNVDVISTNSTIISRVINNVAVSTGSNDNGISDSWSGTGSASLIVNAGCNSNSNNGLHQRVFHCGCTASGFHWVSISGNQSITNQIQIGDSESFHLWVRAPLVAVASAPTIDTQPSTMAQENCINSVPSNLSIAVTSSSTPSYQWYSNTSASNSGGSLITGATSVSYTPVATSSGVTYYYVICTNANGSTISNVSGAVTIIDPVITSTPQNGDMVWKGTTSTSWSSLDNWYLYDGTNYLTASALPTSTDNVIIPESDGVCIDNSPSIDAVNVTTRNLTIETNASLNLNTNTINVSGNYENNGNFNSGTGSVQFNGSVAQYITGSASFYSLIINNSSTGVTLNSPVSVAGNLTMTQGNVMTSGTNILEIGTNVSTVGSINWSSGTVVGPLKRWFSASVNATQASGIFPVGNIAFNRYAQVNFTTIPSSGGYIIAEYIAGAPMVGGVALYDGLPAEINGQMIQNYENEGYYEITPYDNVDVAYGALNDVAYNLILRGNQLTTVTDLTPLRIIKSSGHLTWNDNPVGDGVHNPLTGTTSDFTIGADGMVGFSWFNIGSSNANELPIELVSFFVNCSEENEVNILWATASENNASHFDVQKSRDGTVWSTINTQNAAGFSTSLLHYSFSDQTKSEGISYYRLVQYDLNGLSESFDALSVNCGEEKSIPSLNVFPNPSERDFNLDFFNVDRNSEALINVIDMNGVIHYSATIAVEEGHNVFGVNNLNLSEGMYIIRIKTVEEWTYAKLKIQ